MTAPQVKNQKPSVSVKDEKTFEKEEHQLIYCAFLDTLEDPEEQTQQEMKNKIQGLSKKELSEQEKQKLQSDLKSLKERLPQLQDENEKKIFTFIFENHKKIFNNVNIDPEDIKLLSEENFCQFLLSVFEKIREKKLANKENLENGEIKQVIDDCVSDIRGTEAKDSLIKLAGWPLGVKVDPKNVFGSFKDGLLEKVPFFGEDKKEEDEPPLTDEEMVTTFLCKVFLPVLFSIASISIFGPTTLAVVAAAIGAIFAIKGGVGVLFSNDKKGTLYNPDSQDEKQRKEWDKEISDGISKILETPVKGAEKGTSVSEQISQEKEKSEQQSVPEQISQGDGKNKQHSTSEQIFHPGNEEPATLKQPTLEQPAENIGQQAK